MSAATVRDENIITADANGAPLSVYWSAVNDPTTWNVLPDIVVFDDPLNAPHQMDRFAGFIPLSDPTPGPTSPPEAPQPFPVQAMNSHWHWRHQ